MRALCPIRITSRCSTKVSPHTLRFVNTHVCHPLHSRVAKDPRIKRLTCDHVGTYADDCIVNRVQEVSALLVSLTLCAADHLLVSPSQHKCYIVATMDRELKQRIRKIPGVPIMYIVAHKYSIERMPMALGGKNSLCIRVSAYRDTF